MRWMCRLLGTAAVIAAPVIAYATETEHLGLSVLPATVNVDGDPAEWDLRAGVLACGNVESQRDRFAVWVHAAYDKDHLYLLARWIDHTPLDNPGSAEGSYGFNGDCLQFRIVTAPGSKQERFSHWTCWRDKRGVSVMQATYGQKFKDGDIDGLAGGAKQAFRADADGRGYVQEIAIPWSLLTRGDPAPAEGEKLLFTVEPNFTLGGSARLTIKDIFRPNAPVNRVFTFMDSNCWGTATLETAGLASPRAVRLADAREFPVSIQGGVPHVDWAGLVQSTAPKGFKSIEFEMPEDGYVSLNLFAPDGTVVRQLLTAAFYTKGRQTVLWDGLATPSARVPGSAAPAGSYTWKAIYHTGIGVRLDGRAIDGDGSSWDAWGGDHGNPVAVASDKERVYLGWESGEAGKPLMAVDWDGKPRWKNIRGGIAGARRVASDGKHVYAYNDVARYAAVAIYKLDAKSGNYVEWGGRKSPDLLIKDITDAEAPLTGLAAAGGKVFAAFSSLNRIYVLDAATGNRIRTIDLMGPGDMTFDAAGNLLVIADRNKVARVNVQTGEASVIAEASIGDQSWLSALAIDARGSLYVGVRGEDHRILVADGSGKWERTIGRAGGRAPVGPWQADGLREIAGLSIDPRGQLWCAEDDGQPRRVSVWNAESGALVREFFGASSYGAMGGAVNPLDPNLMVAQGCEWRLDPATGRATLLGTVTRTGIANARFGQSRDGRLFLATTHDAIHGVNPVRLFERLGDARYKLRSTLSKEADGTIAVWSDANDDAQVQEAEVARYKPDGYRGWITGWYMPMTPDLTFYGSNYVFSVTGYTSCGAPLYDLKQARRIAAPADLSTRGETYARKGHGSIDGTLMLYNGQYGAERSTFECYDIASGQRRWSYPNNYVGVHGSHKATGPEVGMIRGAYDIVSSIQLPAPVGNAWVIPTNKGEWHILTEQGFYLTRLFEGDPMQWAWPEKPTPGAILDQCPPGAGEEAFGGSVTQARDGTVYVQVGHTSYWKTHLVGLDSVKALGSGVVDLAAEDLAQAERFRSDALQARAGVKRLAVKNKTVVFTGDLAKDFGDRVSFQKQAAAEIKAALAWDDQHLYAGFEVRDDTPWVNGADAPEFLYARGDTVDLQLGTDPTADARRDEGAAGDIRIAIGSFKGKPVAVSYRKVAAQGKPMTFRSGVVQEYVMQDVRVIEGAQVSVNVDKVKRVYVIEAAIPLPAVGLSPQAGLKLRGDLGATHSNKAGSDTALRTYWSNQNTGIVSDEVYELRMDPSKWGEFVFEK